MTSGYIERTPSLIGKAEPIDLAAFWDALDSFDWGYEWSDDHSVYEAARKQLDEFRSRATLSPAHAALFQAFEAYARARHYSQTTPPEKPARPASSDS